MSGRHNRLLALHIIHPHRHFEIVLKAISSWAAMIVYHVHSLLLNILVNFRGIQKSFFDVF